MASASSSQDWVDLDTPKTEPRSLAAWWRKMPPIPEEKKQSITFTVSPNPDQGSDPDQADPADLADQADQADLADQADQADQADPADPADPSRPSRPSRPNRPYRPYRPNRPYRPIYRGE